MNYPNLEIMRAENYDTYMAKVIKEARSNKLLVDREAFFKKSPYVKFR